MVFLNLRPVFVPRPMVFLNRRGKGEIELELFKFQIENQRRLEKHTCFEQVVGEDWKNTIVLRSAFYMP